MIRAMRTLFVKIFAWFWLTNALLLCVVFVGARLLSRDPRTADPHRGDPFRMVVGTAGDLYRKYGRAELDSMLAGLERRDSVTPFLVVGGREVRGRALPAAAARVASDVLRRDAPVVWARPPRLLFGYPLHGVDGERLALVLSPLPLPRPLGLLVPVSLGGPGLLAVMVIVAGLICLALVRILVAPVRRLQEATRRLAAGDLTARAGYAGRVPGDELEALALDFDRMAERIEQLVGTQQQLLRDISHELRSPLARMSVAIGLARRRTDVSAQPSLDRIERESERLNELIGHLLVLTRLEGRGVPVTWERIDLAVLVDALVADARFEAQSDARVMQRTGDACAVIEGHPELIRSAIENVLRNALRYTAHGGRVEVHVTETPGASQAQVTVRDHGPGVPADQLEAIFRAFHRVQDARDRASGGTGLGLAIAQRAVTAHGGSIVARNAPGGGLEVEIRLPCRQREAAASA
jgi:signal transduction histidine kinase